MLRVVDPATLRHGRSRKDRGKHRGRKKLTHDLSPLLSSKTVRTDHGLTVSDLPMPDIWRLLIGSATKLSFRKVNSSKGQQGCRAAKVPILGCNNQEGAAAPMHPEHRPLSYSFGIDFTSEYIWRHANSST
jgi:hypothetical protein